MFKTFFAIFSVITMFSARSLKLNTFRITQRTRFITTIRSSSSDSPAASTVAPHQLYIGNLPFGVSESDIQASISEKIGNSFTGFRLAVDRVTSKSRGFGHLDFDDQEKAQSALSALGDLAFDGRPVRINVAQPRGERERTERPPRTFENNKTSPDSSIYIGNLNFDATQADIIAFIEEQLGEGAARKVRLSTDRETGRSKGFGHVEFESPEKAEAAIQKLAGLSLGGRPIRVDKAAVSADRAPRAPREREPSSDRGASRQNSVFIGNLAWGVTEDLVKEMVDDVLGPNLYTKVRLAVDSETGRSRGFGHIDFKDAESANRAVVELNELEVLGRQLRADHAQSKDEKSKFSGATRNSRPRTNRYDNNSSQGGGSNYY